MRLEFTPSPFEPSRWMASPHAQTVLGVVLRRRIKRPLLHRERWETADGDFLDVDVLAASNTAPWVLSLHGLEGSSTSGYIRTLFGHLKALGWGGFALNFRSCGGEPNRLLRSYHSGETRDAAFALTRLRERTQGPLFAVGFSLGGNMLLRLLAELEEPSPLAGAAAVSVPFDLDRCTRRLDEGHGWSWFYREYFLRSLRRKALAKACRHGRDQDLGRIRNASGFRAFDDVVTGPWHGFRDAAHYYSECSSGLVLGRIRCPTLILSAKDDPLIPSECFPAEAAGNPALHCCFTSKGGHMGFVSGNIVQPRFWAEEQVVAFFRQMAQKSRAAPPGLHPPVRAP